MFHRRRPRKGTGMLAILGGMLVAVAGISAAIAMSTQPLAPAMFGGGGVLAGLVLGRWGVQQILWFSHR